MERTSVRSARGRRGSRPSGDDRELAILATAEALLGERALSEISIDDLARGAGISRPTFYFYFPSKDAVLLALLDRVIAQAETTSLGFLDHLPDDPARHWRSAINAFYESFGAHRAVALACAQARRTNPEVQRLWAAVMGTWVDRTATAIQAERDRGAAPDGIPARDLALVLNSMNERVLHAVFAAEEPALAEADAVDTLLQVWLSSIYSTYVTTYGSEVPATER
ncbi:TetR/AcrR family transcriptional regulator [Streptomyces monticola]|uniref:TetR/AcrR family transcriptional regulator n=1 Tax=Streptomyces monticola TaxID=2666263 RepID=A0ABW2JLA7_9ACTN